jgi:hypothetical protein
MTRVEYLVMAAILFVLSPFIYGGYWVLTYPPETHEAHRQRHRRAFVLECAEHRPLVDCKIDALELYPND